MLDYTHSTKTLAKDWQECCFSNSGKPEEILNNLIERSPNILAAAEIIQKTETYLKQKSTLQAMYLVRLAIPLILRKTYQDKQLIAQFAQAAIDDTPISSNWQTTVDWISDKLGETELSYFYEWDTLAGIHPLVSRKLKNSHTTPPIETYCTWLTDTIFRAENIPEDIPSATLLASAYLIIHQARQQGVTIEAEGNITIPESASLWGELTEIVLNRIVIESETRNITREINLFSNWHKAPLIFNLRKRSRDRLQPIIENLSKLINQLSPTTKNSEVAQLAQQINTTKQELEKRLTSAFAPANLPEIAINNLDIPMPISIYLQKLMAQKLDFSSQIIIKNQSITETLDKLPLWQETINQKLSDNPNCPEILKAWAKIDIWSELRHQSAPISPLPNNLNAENLDTLRPKLAAIVYLGDANHRQQLLETLGSLNNPSLVSAIRIEIFLSNLTKENTPNFNNINQLSQWIQSACQSDNLWELRAGMNGAIFLARLGEITGNIYPSTILRDTLNSAPWLKELVKHSINQLLQPPNHNSEESGLPLALAAFDLMRYYREHLLRIAPSITEDLQPLWWQKNSIIPLINRLSSIKFPPVHLAREGGYGAQLLLLTIFNIELDQLKWERQLTVKPHYLPELDSLQTSLRYLFCRQQLFLTPTAINETIPWLQISHWNSIALTNAENQEDTPQGIELYNWVSTHNSLLTKAGMLDTTYNSINEATPTDIDNRYPGEFPTLSYQEARNRLQQPVNQLQNLETQYINRLERENQDNQHQEIISLLQHPLNLATVDYQEQINASIADVKKAEAELEIAEWESIAAGLEVEVQALFHQAAEVEVERQKTLIAVSQLDEEIAQLDRQISEIEAQQTRGEINNQERNVRIAELKKEQSLLRINQINRSKNAIEREIKLLKKLLEEEIPKIATAVENNVINKIDQGIVEAERNKQRAIEAAAARRKRGFWRRLFEGVCRFLGAVIGSVFGGPLGAAIGAQIGSTVANLTCNIIKGKSFSEIFTELIKDVNQVAAIAGIDLEKELNKLGAKGAKAINQLLDKVESNFATILNNIPQVIEPRKLDAIIANTVEIFDLTEINQLTQIIQKSYQGLRQDVNTLGQIGTVLKQLGNNEAIDLSNPRQLLTSITDNLNTTANIETIEVIATAVNEKVDNLRNDPEERYKVLEKFGKIVITKISQESYDFKQNTLSTWIQSQQKQEKWWDNPTVREEGKKLVEELFPDKKTTYQVLANLEYVLCNPEKVKGKIQYLISPWQAALETRINEITAVEQNQPQPTDPIQAAQQQIDYLQETKAKFNNNLLPWLRGRNNPERDELLRKLDELSDTTLPNIEDELTRANLDEVIANLNQENAAESMEIVEQKLEQLEKYYEITDIRISQASLTTKAVELAQLQAQNLEDAKDKSLEAARAKQQAAKAQVTSAQYNLASYQAQAAAIKKRGVEASHIRDILSQPPLRLPTSATQTVHQIRLEYLRTLEKSFIAYRELLRYYQASGNNDDFTTIEAIDSHQPWSTTLSNYHNQIGEIFTGSCRQTSNRLELNLTPSQIKSLLSPEGFKIIALPEVESLLTLFTVPVEWKVYLDNLGSSNRQQWLSGFKKLWLPVFASHGINLGDGENITVSKISQGWQISAPDPEPTQIFLQPSLNGNDFPIQWAISAPVTYLVREKDNQLFISYRNNIREEARSDFSDRHFFSLNPKEIKTGKIAAIFLEGKVANHDSYITKQEYEPTVVHLGQMWTERGIEQVQSRKLNSNRIFLISASTNLGDRLQQESQFFQGQGDPNPYSVQGNPLSGTTVIRLTPTSCSEAFESLKLYIFYSYVGSAE